MKEITLFIIAIIVGLMWDIHEKNESFRTCLEVLKDIKTCKTLILP